MTPVAEYIKGRVKTLERAIADMRIGISELERMLNAGVVEGVKGADSILERPPEVGKR